MLLHQCGILELVHKNPWFALPSANKHEDWSVQKGRPLPIIKQNQLITIKTRCAYQPGIGTCS